MVSRRDRYRLSDSGPVVSSMGTTSVGTVPFMLILQVSACSAGGQNGEKVLAYLR